MACRYSARCDSGNTTFDTWIIVPTTVRRRLGPRKLIKHLLRLSQGQGPVVGQSRRCRCCCVRVVCVWDSLDTRMRASHGMDTDRDVCLLRGPKPRASLLPCPRPTPPRRSARRAAPAGRRPRPHAAPFLPVRCGEPFFPFFTEPLCLCGLLLATVIAR